MNDQTTSADGDAPQRASPDPLRSLIRLIARRLVRRWRLAATAGQKSSTSLTPQRLHARQPDPNSARG